MLTYADVCSFDVDSFYRDLEHNAVFALTRRAFGGAANASSRQVYGCIAELKLVVALTKPLP
jgi:hypothetical protein